VRGVFKIGGSVVKKTPMPIWVDELKARILAHDQIVVVHGGGSLISRELEARGEPVRFVQGQRVTSHRALTVVLSVLKGQVNGELVAYLAHQGISTVGISGIDLDLLQALPVSDQLGRVGKIHAVDLRLIEALWQAAAVPVVAPLAGDGLGGILNVNGDVAAGALAGALRADYLIYYTDSGGVREVASDPTSIRLVLHQEEAHRWIEDGTVSAGMIPKLRSGLLALDQGVSRVAIGAYRLGAGTELRR